MKRRCCLHEVCITRDCIFELDMSCMQYLGRSVSTLRGCLLVERYLSLREISAPE